MRKSILLIAGLFVAIIFSACSKNDDHSPTPEKPPVENADYKLSSGVKTIDDNWEQYVGGVVNDSVIELSSNAGAIMPKVGDILIKTSSSDKFPYGFLGKVVEMKQGGGKTEVVTENVALDEAFEELSSNETIDIVDNISTITNGENKTISFTKNQSSPFRASIEKTVSFGVNVDCGDSATTLTGSIEMGLKLDFNMNIHQSKVEYFKMALTPAFTANLKLTSEFSGNIADSILIATIYLTPITVGPLIITPKLNVYASAGLSGKISLSAEATYTSSSTFGCYYDGSNWYSIKPENDSSDNRSPLTGTFSMEGRIGIGPILELRFSFYNRDNLSAAIEGKALLAFTANFEWNAADAVSGGLYESLRGVKGKLSMPVEGKASLTVSLFKYLKIEPTFTEATEFVIAEFPLLPNITNLKVTDGSSFNEKVGAYTLTDDVLFPGKFGMKLYDDNNTLLDTYYYNDKMTYVDSLPTTKPTFTFSNLTNQKTYTARPVFSIFGLLEVVEKQSMTFKVEEEPDSLVLSTYEIDFKKEGGGDSLTINTNLKIMDIYSTQTWCNVSYDANNPKTVNVTVDENSTTESRSATIWIDAVNPVTNDKTSKGVLINQEGENVLANTTWSIYAYDEEGGGDFGTITFNSDSTCYQNLNGYIFNGNYTLSNNDVEIEVSRYFPPEDGDPGFVGTFSYTGQITGNKINGSITQSDGGLSQDVFANFTATKIN